MVVQLTLYEVRSLLPYTSHMIEALLPVEFTGFFFVEQRQQDASIKKTFRVSLLVYSGYEALD
jgi:hypothetical protein